MSSVSFSLLDSDGKPAVLRFDAAAVPFTLTLTNVGADPIPLTAGRPLDEHDAATASDGATRWYLPIPLVVPEKTVAVLQFTSDVWTVWPYKFRGRTLWGFTSNGAQPLPPNGTIGIGLQGLVVPAQPQLPALNLTASVYLGSPAVPQKVSFSVPIAPDASTNSLVASIWPQSNTVYVSSGAEEYPNTVTVLLQNGPTALPLGPASTVTIELPIAAAVAPNTDAITTSAFSEILCSVPSASGSVWDHDTTTPIRAGNVAFSITPKSDPALPPGGTLMIDLAGIISPLPSGTASIRVGSSGFDGFPDNVTNLPVVLEPLPAPSFSRAGVVGAQPLGYDVPLQIEWEADYATSLTLEYDDGISKYTFTSSANGLPLSGTWILQNTTVDAQVTLTASNVHNGGTPQGVPVEVVPSPTPALSVEFSPAAWDFGAGAVEMTYTLTPEPARLLTALTVDGPDGVVSLMGRTTYAVLQTSAVPLVFTATFGTGVGLHAHDIPVSPVVPSLASYVVGTKWTTGDFGDGVGAFVYTFIDEKNGTINDFLGLTQFTYTADANTVAVTIPTFDPFLFHWDGNQLVTVAQNPMFVLTRA